MNASKWRIVLLAAGGQYLVGSVVWIGFALAGPQQIPAVADWSFFPAYRSFFHDVVSEAPAPWALAVAVGEFTLGVLILRRKGRSLGLGVATVFQGFLAGVTGPVGVVNLGIAAGQLALLRHYRTETRPSERGPSAATTTPRRGRSQRARRA